MNTDKKPFTIVTPIRAIIDFFARQVSKYFTGKNEMPAVPPSTGKPLILFLHGYGGSPRNFYWFYQRLRPVLGERFDFAWLLMDPGMGMVPEQNALAVVEYLQRYGMGEREIHIMGHSAGGLVGRWSSLQFPPEIPLEHQDFPVNHWEIVEDEAVAQAIIRFFSAVPASSSAN